MAHSPPLPPIAMFRWRDLLNLAGALTLVRIPLAALFVFVTEPRLAVLIYATGLATDVVDGWVARGLGQRSDAGAFADGLCDKVFHGVVALTLALVRDAVPLWWLVPWFSREIVQIATLPWMVRRIRQAPERRRHADEAGKLTSVLLSAACVTAMMGRPDAALVLTIGTGILGAYAGVRYSLRERGA